MIGDVTERGEPIIGDSILLLANAYHEANLFALPGVESSILSLGTIEHRSGQSVNACCPDVE